MGNFDGQSVEINFDVYLHAKKSTSSLTSSLRYCKDIANLLFWELWECLTIPNKTIVLICRKPSCSSACKKSTSSLTSFVRHCKEITNLLFWVFGHVWPHTPKTIVSIWRNFQCLSAGKKINFIRISLEILERHCELVILGTLGMLGFAHTTWYYQLVENFRVYLQVKRQLHRPCFSGDIAKICKLFILDTLGKPGYAHPKWYYQLVENFDIYLHAENTLHHSLLSWDNNLENPAIWLVDNILAHNWKTTILPDMGFWWWNINNNIGLHFRLFQGKTNGKIFQKIQKILF